MKKTKTFLASLVLAAGVAGGASATTYDFTGSSMPAGLGYDCDAGQGLNVNCKVSFNAAGLGVAGPGDNHEDVALIDSWQGKEALILSFGGLMRISQIVIGLVNELDDFVIKTAAGTYSFPQGSAPSVINLNDISDYIIVTALPDEARRQRDFITLAGVTATSAVPLPASGLLLVGGLAAGLALRRRRKAA